MWLSFHHCAVTVRGHSILIIKDSFEPKGNSIPADLHTTTEDEIATAVRVALLCPAQISSVL